MDLPDFTPKRTHLFLRGVYGDYPYHNNGSYLDGEFADDAFWQRRRRQLDVQSASWYATPSGAVGRRFLSILAAEWRGVLGRSWNSKRRLVLSHVVLKKTLGVRAAKEIRARITRRMELWERGLHAGLAGDAKAEGVARDFRSASRGEEEDEAVSRIYHNTVMYGKLRQVVRWTTDRGEGGYLLLDYQCTKTGQPVAEVLR